jgi:sialic acid synthase
MCTLDELDAALAILSARPRDVVILHCISEYPARYENMNLRALGFLQQRYPNHTIGYSDHSIGIVMPAVAVALGAKVIEKHITLNRNMKGSDHAGSLEPEGLWRVVRDIRNTEKALGQETKSLHPAVAATREKLARSLALALPLRQGETLRETYLCMRSPGSGLPWDERTRLLGKKARRDLPANSLLREEDFS